MMKAAFTAFLVALVALSPLAMASDVSTTSEATVEESIDTAPATLFFFSQTATPPSNEPEVLNFGDTVTPNNGGSTGLPVAIPGASPY